MFNEDQLIPISTLAHAVFCWRRVSLIYIEQLWQENVATLEGSQLHEKVHQEGSVETRGNLRLIRGLRLRSFTYGITGKADMVEFHRIDDPAGEGYRFANSPYLWQPFPVEYKRGKLRNEQGYIMQLCAQAFCLEEMLQTRIDSGAIFFGKTNRRLDIVFDTVLRKQTAEIIRQLHELFISQKTPEAKYQKKCRSCSLLDLCMPKSMKSHHRASWYIDQVFQDEREGDD
jgi:CRISPR-associated exonuclease Cas4